MHAALICPELRHSFAVVSRSSRQIESGAVGMNRVYCPLVKVVLYYAMETWVHRDPHIRGPQALLPYGTDKCVIAGNLCVILYIKGNLIFYWKHAFIIHALLLLNCPLRIPAGMFCPSSSLSRSFWPSSTFKLPPVIVGSQLMGFLHWYIAFVRHVLVLHFN